MLQKWKNILANWINCYFEKDTKTKYPLTSDCLVNILSQLRENFNLDESTSSIDAHTLQEFILEKYPEFRFENGNLEPANAEDIYLAASLLLYFVCVNSKDMDIKKAMCKELSVGDQEIILKFSKCLMNCSDISSTEVLTAIAEACGQDAACSNTVLTTVAETPPALRSLHNEVRRLQAALDAERFDRNYLQEELARINLKMEKLVKDKEQYKQDIVNLKGKLSTCVQDNYVQDTEVSNNNLGKLIKQLEQAEQRLVTAQEKLDDVQYERDMYKNKLHELKRDRDKWIETSQEETSRAVQLAEELETERKQVHSLRELVTELKQHNRLNGFDTSQLECDDLDASVRAVHNTSVCSEAACTYVIEVQLSEERAKIVVLEQQIKLLQDQLNCLTKKSEEETQNLLKTISEKDNDIFNLKHRINEEIEDKNNLKLRYDDKVTRLNNDANELEQRLRANGENSRRIIDSKMKEIQILQEEKLSLLQSLTDETTKLENIIQKLNSDIDSEKSSKLRIIEEYENKVMKLNEKVLNRNNELVELQNKICENGEAIEKLQFDLRKEKELRGDLVKKYNNDIRNLNIQVQAYDTDLNRKNDEINNLKDHIQKCNVYTKQLEKDVENLNSCLSKCKNDINVLEDFKAKILIELQNKETKIVIIQKEKEHLLKEYAEERNTLQYNLDEISASTETLRNQLQNEIQYKISIQNELHKFEKSNNKLTETINNLNKQLATLKLNCNEMEQSLIIERKVTAESEKKSEYLETQVEKLNKDISQKENMIKVFKETLEAEKIKFDEEYREKNNVIDSLNKNFTSEITNLNEQITTLKLNCNEMEQCLSSERNVVDELKKTCEDMNIQVELLKRGNTEKENMIIVFERSLEEAKIKYDEECREKDKVINMLDIKLKSELAKLNTENQMLRKDVSDKSDIIINLQNDISKLSQQAEEFKHTIDELKNTIDKKTKAYDHLQNNFNVETTTLVTKLKEMDQSLNELQIKSNNIIRAKELQVENLKIDIDKLQTSQQQEQDEKNNLEQEKTVLLQQLNDANTYRTKFEKEYLNKCAQLSEEILRKNAVINDLKNTLEISTKNNENQTEAIKSLSNNLNEALQNTKDVTVKKDKEIEKLSENVKQLELLVIQSEKELKTVIDTNTQLIEALQKENAQLLYNVKEVNSSHDLLVKEKNVIIEDLEAQLKHFTDSFNLVQKKYEHEKYVWEKLKTEMLEEINLKSNLEAQLRILHKEKVELTEEVSSLRKTCTESAHTNDNLKKSLVTEKAIKDTLESEKLNLIKEKEYLMKKIEAGESAYRKISSEKDSLLNEKAILVQELTEEKSVRQIADEGKGSLYVENQKLDNRLREVQSMKNDLLQEKECLTQQLVEERLVKDLAEQEKKNIIDVKIKLEEQLSAETLLRAEMQRKDDSLVEKIQHLEKENAILINEMALLTTEKEMLSKSYTDLLQKITDLNKNFDSEIADKMEKMENLTMSYERLNYDYNALKEDKKQICILLNSGITKVFKNMKKDNICSEILCNYDKILAETANNDEKCDAVFKILDKLVSELTLKKKLEKAFEKESTVVKEISAIVKQKEKQVAQLQDEIHNLEKEFNQNKADMLIQSEKHNLLLETKTSEIQQLQLENKTLRNELNDVKVQLEVKVHSLKDKLIDNENLTDKLKKTYECQIDNLNVMITKLTNYLKEKTTEVESLRNEKERLQHLLEDNSVSIKTLEEDLKMQKQNQEKLINDFESERLVLKNMVTVTESVMEDQKDSLNKIITEHTKTNQVLEDEVRNLKQIVEKEKYDAELKLQDKGEAFKTVFKELTDLRKEKETAKKVFLSEKEILEKKTAALIEQVSEKTSKIDVLTAETEDIREKLKEQTKDLTALEETNNEWKIKNETLEVEFGSKVQKLEEDLQKQCKCTNALEVLVKDKERENAELSDHLNTIKNDYANLENEKANLYITIDKLNAALENHVKEYSALVMQSKKEILDLNNVNEDMKTKIKEIEECLQSEVKKFDEHSKEKVNITNKCHILEEYQIKAEVILEEHEKEIAALNDTIKTLKSNMEKDICKRDRIIEELNKEKDEIIEKFNKELIYEKKCLKDARKLAEVKDSEIEALTRKLEEIKQREETISILKNENDRLTKAIGQRETCAVASHENSSAQYPRQVDHEHLQKQVDTTSTDYSSMESNKTISDLEKIVQDKNRTITTLQNDITYLKSLVADSENKYLDVANSLDMSKEHCQQLSSQLTKIVHQKNEEIADLKRQVIKMSATENRASQIIKVSAKYQAIILKRIAEIKSNTVLKELTNFGNTNCDSDLRKSLTAGTVTMEDLENFLETTERHIRRCSEKQIALQKERDRLTEVNRINESEIINMRKFLTELSVSIKTFNSVRELYTQSLGRVVSVQRTVRREILSLDGRITDAAMGKLERGYSAVMQDLSECAMNLERWIERCVSRTMSPEKIKQAFTSQDERASLSFGSFQNKGLEVQLKELENSFEKLLEDVARAQKGEDAKDAQSITVMEVRAEYEDKLNRMKEKMKLLYQEQIAKFKEKQHDEIVRLEFELKKTQKKLQECESHIKSLTTELWNIGEKYVMQKDEADWLRKKQQSGSLMSLQHVHSSGLVPPQKERGRPSDTQSLRSLPVNTKNNTKEGRGLHMSDEEGEVFDNRCLRELAVTPRRDSEVPPGHRISELRYRNSLCPPHLKSSYPAETQFAPAIQEEDIKCVGSTSMSLGGRQRKEVGITAYKKPGPPTPSKQAGRLSATDSELRESLRIDVDPSASRKTSTPSRIRSLFRSAKNDTTEGTPRGRRLSNIFRKK